MSLKLSAGCQCCDVEPPITDLCICGETVQMILIFQDEAQTVYNPSGTGIWDIDVADWEDKTDKFGQPEYAQFCQVWTTTMSSAPNEATSVCKPTARDFPDGWTWDELVRYPTEAECKAVYDSAKGGAGVDDPTDLVLLGVDVSGSMNLGTLGTGYSDFKDYLDSIGVDYKQVLFGDERWVKLTAENYTDTVGGETPAEFDLILADLQNGTDCDICEDLVGAFTLTDPVQITNADDPTIFESDGWSGDAWSRAADVPSGATHACVWKYEASEYCTWSETGFFDDVIVKRFDFQGILLARFKLSDTEYKWRVIILYQLTLSCEGDWSSDETLVNSGWFFEFTDTAPDCNLTGDETWVSYFPDSVPLLEVYCNDGHEAEFSDFCGDSSGGTTLTLTSVETG